MSAPKVATAAPIVVPSAVARAATARKAEIAPRALTVRLAHRVSEQRDRKVSAHHVRKATARLAHRVSEQRDRRAPRSLIG